MAKKAKAKKKGKKGKGAPQKKEALSHLEKETLLQKISYLQQKIAGRNQLIDVIDDDVHQYKQAFFYEKDDKTVCSKLLEQAIQEQEAISDRTKRAIPDVESFKLQAEVQARELPAKLSNRKDEKASHDAQLRAIRNRVQNLESYDSQATERKIKELQEELAKEDPEEVLVKRMELDKRREEMFAKELRAILEEETDSFQEGLKGSSDDHFEMVAEETRWWSYTVNNLRLMLERLEDSNSAGRKSLSNFRAQLYNRRESAGPATLRLQEQERMLLAMKEKTERFQQQQRGESVRWDKLKQLKLIRNKLNGDLSSHELALQEAINMLSVNEEEIKKVEAEVDQRTALGLDLMRIVHNVQDIIAAEVKSDLIITYDGPPKKQDIIKELAHIFDSAAKFIFDYSFKVPPKDI